MPRGVKAGIVGTVFAGMLGVAGFGAYNIYDGLDDGGGGGTSAQSKSATVDTRPPSAEDVSDTAADFLTAWASGDLTRASALTDSVRTSTAALTSYKTDAHVTSVQLVPGVATATTPTTVPFTVTAQVAYQSDKSTWSYRSSLTVVRGIGGKPVVQWKPSVLHPALKDGESLETGRASTPDVDVVDRHGEAMTTTDFPSLTGIFTQLRAAYASKATGGTPGVETWVKGEDGAEGRTLLVLAKGKNAKVKTTLDVNDQRAAEKAVAKRANSAVVAVKASTGQILAVANNPATGQNLAFGATVAPGSTFKVVTAAALLQRGVRPSDHVSCAKEFSAGGKPYTNVEKSSNPQADFRWDFANSCNTGFVRLHDRIGPDTLPTVASENFGIGPRWNVGVSTFDGKVPGGSGDEMTSEMIGQGQIQMDPLNMASIAATASTGAFHQPTIVSPSLIDGPIATAKGLSAGVTADLRSMMNTTAVSGTAAQAMIGVPGPKGAKTGSAEAGEVQPNGWFLGYSGDVAAAALVLNGGHGGSSAGPIVASVLRAS